jgi:hypothetical protein
VGKCCLSGGGGAKPSGLDILRGVDRSGTYKIESYMEKPAFTRGGFIQCQSYPSYYACTLGGVVMSDGDGTDSYTQILLLATCEAYGLVLSCQSINTAAFP